MSFCVCEFFCFALLCAGLLFCWASVQAHRGTGAYAYVNVIREVAAATSHFRVLALSATPGSDIKVCCVCDLCFVCVSFELLRVLSPLLLLLLLLLQLLSLQLLGC